jgi:hypothetical protein
MDQENLISTLKSQHLTLKADLRIAADDVSLPDQVNGEEILMYFSKFKKDLSDHLKIENENFYPDLLRKMKKRNQDTTNTEKFIAEMIDIGKVITAFLGKYNSIGSISNQSSEFSSQLQDIISTLNLRIESEEEGVFEIYLAMTN